MIQFGSSEVGIALFVRSFIILCTFIVVLSGNQSEDIIHNSFCRNQFSW